MSIYFLKTSRDNDAVAIDLPEGSGAWPELRSVCCDLMRTILRRMPAGTEWKIEIQDESRNPMFRITLVAEALIALEAQDGLSAPKK